MIDQVYKSLYIGSHGDARNKIEIFILLKEDDRRGLELYSE